MDQKEKKQEDLQDINEKAEGMEMAGIGVICLFAPERDGIADEMGKEEKREAGSGDCHDIFFADGRAEYRKNPGHFYLGVK
jgi:hypothetical protein